MAVSKRIQVGVYLVLFLALRMCRCSGPSSCYRPQTSDLTLREIYCNQPMFTSFILKTPETQLLDNVCQTLFPSPDDPDTFTFYQSAVYCDGSSSVETFLITMSGMGQAILANPVHHFHDYNLGYVGCDTYVSYRCLVYGENVVSSFIFGFGPKCNAIGLSCLRKVSELISSRGLPDEDFYVLPMKLPNRCVTQQLCLQPPNPFYNKLPNVAIY